MKRVFKYFVFIAILFIIIVMSSWVIWHTSNGGKRVPKRVSNFLLQIAQLPSLTHLLILNNFKLSDGRLIADSSKIYGFQYFVDSIFLPQGKILVSNFTQKKDIEIKLINISNGFLIKKWSINAETVIKLDQKGELDKKNLRLVHPLPLKDSSIVVNTSNLLLCFNSKSQLKWVNHEIFHHSIELLNDSTLWTCSRIESTNPYTLNGIDTLNNDAIVKVNTTTGKTIFKKSVTEILVENGFQYLLAIGNFETDAIHLNEVCPATSSSKYWNQGDLLISLRHRSTVFLYRPSTNKIIWLKTGPWSNQHSCSFIDSTRIMVFGNDVIRSGINTTLLNGNNHIYIYNFSNNTIITPYNKVMEELQIKTLSEGRATYLEGGKVFIDESNNGKVYIIDSLKPLLKYTERADPTHIKIFNWNRYIPN